MIEEIEAGITSAIVLQYWLRGQGGQGPQVKMSFPKYMSATHLCQIELWLQTYTNKPGAKTHCDDNFRQALSLTLLIFDCDSANFPAVPDRSILPQRLSSIESCLALGASLGRSTLKSPKHNDTCEYVAFGTWIGKPMPLRQA